MHLPGETKCTGCGACAASCPKGCIAMESDKKGFLYPNIDYTQCVNCKKCEDMCPVLRQKTEDCDVKANLFAAFTRDDSVRNSCSSGGVFFEIARYIINHGGVVFGAAFSEDFKTVEHIAVEEEKELYRLSGSKYLQSKILTCFDQAKKRLESGQVVLFSGTPCQINGLKAFLKKDYKNLYLVDFICHGVPSPLVWKKYVLFRESNSNSTVKMVDFRNKKYGWQDFSLRIVFKNGKYYHKKIKNDLYMRGFLHDIYLRPSCYECCFRQIERPADITLADYWGIQQVEPNMNDDKGTSLVIVHSKNGNFLLKEISNLIIIKQTTERAFSFNPAITNSPSKPKNSDEFWDDIEKEEFSKVLKRFCRVTFKDYIKRLQTLALDFAIGLFRKIFPKKRLR